jgi:methylase of polypeptide subunit release factors
VTTLDAVPGPTRFRIPRGERRLRFAGLSIAFDERVLAPRQWTVAQADWARALLKEAPPGPVLELCAGAGQIGLAATRESGRTLVIVEADPHACAFARRNAVAAGVGDRTEVRCSDLDHGLRRGEQFPLVLADPPWVPSSHVQQYPDDPPLAIDGGFDGFDVALRCIEVIGRHVAGGGSALLQLGTPLQAERLTGSAALEQAGLRVTDVRDYGRGVVCLLGRAA